MLIVFECIVGTKYLYSTYGWTLLSAVVEGASGKKFPEIMKDFFKQLGLENTYLDENKPLIYNRARCESFCLMCDL